MQGGGGIAGVGIEIPEPVLWILMVLLLSGGAWTLWKVLWAAR